MLPRTLLRRLRQGWRWCRAISELPAQVSGECAALPGRRLRWIVPNAPGGGYDTETRLLEPFLERRIAVDIVIDNQPGAGGMIGARAIAERVQTA